MKNELTKLDSKPTITKQYYKMTTTFQTWQIPFIYYDYRMKG